MPVIVANRTGEVDSAYHTLVKHINSPVPIVMVSWSENFIFNDDLLNIKDYVLCCFCEYGWNTTIIETHIWGKNSENFPRYYNKDWVTFDKWVKENPPRLLLKRELLKKDVSEKIQPIEYPCLVDKFDIQTKEQFDSRAINVFQYWGRSNECRIRIQGDIWHHAFKKGFQPCDNLFYVNSYLQNESGEKWVTLWIPHWARVDISELMKVNNLSKLSLSWPGAGFKCFRTAEASANSVMVMRKNNFAWSHDWNETNCILVEPGKEIEGIEKALSNPYLHEIYLNGVENCNRYRPENYIPYLEKLINAAIK